jgi:hypothetical protein
MESLRRLAIVILAAFPICEPTSELWRREIESRPAEVIGVPVRLVAGWPKTLKKRQLATRISTPSGSFDTFHDSASHVGGTLWARHAEACATVAYGLTIVPSMRRSSPRLWPLAL